MWYFGRVVADRDVAWHYPWVMFLATVPVGLHALGVCGLFIMTVSLFRSKHPVMPLANPPATTQHSHAAAAHAPAQVHA